MRQVNEAELVWNIRLALRQVRAMPRKGFAGSTRDAQASAELTIAVRIAQQLKRYEILSSGPLPSGSDLFSRAAYGRSDQAMLGDGSADQV
jgi:hypothetical protein